MEKYYYDERFEEIQIIRSPDEEYMEWYFEKYPEDILGE